MSTKTIEFAMEKETKGTCRYQEMGDKPNHAVGTLYIKKGVLPTPYPANVKVTLDFGG